MPTPSSPRSWRFLLFRPNVEFGIGEVTAEYALNLEAVYRLRFLRERDNHLDVWNVSVGAGPRATLFNQEFRERDFNIQLASLISTFLVLVGQIILAVILFAVGLYLANLAAASVAASKTRHASLLATLARGAIIIVAASMALRTAGLANEIVDLVFGLTFGAAATAAALAFGLGARETAGQFVEDWTKQFRQP